MSALYAMHYLGGTGVGIGTMYVGRGVFVGADAGGGRYHGTYTEQAGRFKGTGTLSMVENGVLVTGVSVPAGTKIPLTMDWLADFANGKPQKITVTGGEVQVTFNKVGDVP